MGKLDLCPYMGIFDVISHVIGHVIGHMTCPRRHVTSHVTGHVIGHVKGHVMTIYGDNFLRILWPRMYIFPLLIYIFTLMFALKCAQVALAVTLF